MSDLTHKEVSLLTQLAQAQELFSQRQLAQKTGISIGLVNAVLKKMIHHGYVKSKALNKKKMSYLLTPKGVIQVTRNTYQSVVSTIKRYQELELTLSSLMAHLIADGHTTFVLAGSGELAEIVHRLATHHFKNQVEIVDEMITSDAKTVVINTTHNELEYQGKVVNIVDYLHHKLN